MEAGHRPIPNMLRRNRKIGGYTQVQVAALLGLHRAIPLSQWERGTAFPSVLNLLKLSALYQVPAHELYEPLFSALREVFQEKVLEQFIACN